MTSKKINEKLLDIIIQFIIDNKIAKAKFANDYLEISDSYFSQILSGRREFNLDNLQAGFEKNGFVLDVKITLAKKATAA